MQLARRNFLHGTMAFGASVILPRFVSAQVARPAVDMPVPPINSVDEVPPARSTPVVLARSPRKRMFMFADSDNSSKNNFVSDVPNVCPDHGTYGVLVNYWDGKPAADYTLTLRQFWRLIENSYTTVPAGNQVTQTFTHSWGISTTDSETITATLGYSSGDGPGLNGSISDTFSHSVTTDRADQTQFSRQIDAPDDGKVRVWMAWQLVHELVALDPEGKVVPEGCRCERDRKADVKWSFIGPACGGLFGQSGAWVYYQKTRWLFPSKIIRVSQRDFPTS